MNLTNEQATRVIMLYTPCYGLLPDNTRIYIEGVYKSDALWYVKYLIQDSSSTMNGVDGAFLVDSIKLLLTPLSAITDEDKNEIGVLLNGLEQPSLLSYAAEKYTNALVNGLSGIPHESYGLTSMFARISAYQYLIQYSYAVPLFIAPNHRDNGKTAIELGLALDATTYKPAAP